MKRWPYQLKQRARSQAATRERIIEATMILHTTVGPSRTTISGIAERAGVQRQTVYAHFPDEDALFGACTSLWAQTYPFPDPAGWEAIADPHRRLVAALVAIYSWYELVQEHLVLFRRDVAATPPAVRAQQEEQYRHLAASLASGVSRRKVVATTVALAISFETWQSLHGSGMSNQAAATLMARLVLCAAGGPVPPPAIRTPGTQRRSSPRGRRATTSGADGAPPG